MNNKGHTDMIKALANTVLWVVVCLVSANVIAQTSITSAEGVVGEGESITLIDTGNGFGTTGPTIFMWDDFQGQVAGIPIINGNDVAFPPGAKWVTLNNDTNGLSFQDNPGPGPDPGIGAFLDWQTTGDPGLAFGSESLSGSKLFVSYRRLMQGEFTPLDSGHVHKQFIATGESAGRISLRHSLLTGTWVLSNESALEDDNTKSWNWSVTDDVYQRWNILLELGGIDSAEMWLDGVKGYGAALSFNLPDSNFIAFHLGHSKSPAITNPKASEAWFDDVYIASNEARVEICSEAVWSESTPMDCELQIVNSWAGGLIQFNFRRGRFPAASLSGKFFYVIREDGVTNFNGLSLATLFSVGDINADNKIDISDVLLLEKHLVGEAILTGDSFMRADVAPVGGDGELTVADLAVLEKMVVAG